MAIIQKQNFNRIFSINKVGSTAGILYKRSVSLSPAKLAFALFFLTWVPLAILTAIEGTLLSDIDYPFLLDISIQGRILIGVTFFVIIKNRVMKDTPDVLKYIHDVLLNEKDRDIFKNRILNKVKRLSESVFINILFLLVVAYVAHSTAKGVSIMGEDARYNSWFYTNEEGKVVLSGAGLWANYISKPVFQFLLLKWIWRYAVWVLMLFRISRMNLRLSATHPDEAGGLSVILLAHRGYTFFFLVCAIVVSSVMINRLLEKTVAFEMLKIEILGLVIFGLLVLITPLLFFSGRLSRLKYEGQLKLSNVGTKLSNRFEDRLVNPVQNKVTPDTAEIDPSPVYDYTGLFNLLKNLHVVPLTFSDVLIICLVLFLPFIPIFFIQYSIGELLQKILGLLF